MLANFEKREHSDKSNVWAGEATKIFTTCLTGIWNVS